MALYRLRCGNEDVRRGDDGDGECNWRADGHDGCRRLVCPPRATTVPDVVDHDDCDDDAKRHPYAPPLFQPEAPRLQQIRRPAAGVFVSDWISHSVGRVQCNCRFASIAASKRWGPGTGDDDA